MLRRLDVGRVALCLVFVGEVFRVALALKVPATGDMEGFYFVASVLHTRGLSVYSGLSWLFPYPPGFIPWLLFASHFSATSFAVLERLVPDAADAVLAWLVFSELRARSASPGRVVAAVALIAFGPVFIAVSAVNGQIDAVAFVFVLLAVRAWRTVPLAHRALAAGLLLGVGGAIKVVPLLFVFAFLPTVANWREGARLVLGAALVPALAMLPFVVADAAGVRHALSYAGLPGGGGLSLLADPGLAKHYLTDYDLRTSGLADWLERYGLAVTLAAVIGVSAWLHRVRLPPIDASVVLATTLLLFAVNFYEQYLLWLLPLALASGRIALPVVLEAIMVPYLWVTGALPYIGTLEWLGVTTRAAIQIACVCAVLLTLAVTLGRSLRQPRPGSHTHTGLMAELVNE